jgi:hypothetical protein
VDRVSSLWPAEPTLSLHQLTTACHGNKTWYVVILVTPTRFPPSLLIFLGWQQKFLCSLNWNLTSSTTLDLLGLWTQRNPEESGGQAPLSPPAPSSPSSTP